MSTGPMEAVWLPVLPSFKGFGAALARGAAADADKQGKGLGLSLGKSMVAGVAAGAVGLAAAGTALYKVGSVFSDVSTTISVATGASGADLDRLTAAAKRVGSNVPVSFEEVSTAVASVQSSLGGFSNMTEAEFDQATTNALNFSKAFEQDTDRVTQVVGQMMKTGLVTDANEAFDLLTAASQKVPAALRGDLLDAVDEYGPFFAQLGLSGEEAMNALASASDKGVFGIDKTGDALKEFTIRSTDMSKASGDAYAALGLSQDEMSAALLAGGDVGSEAFQKIIGGLQGMQDPVAQSQAALALFGTPLEDLGTGEIPQFIDALAGAESVLGDVEGAAGRMGESLNSGPGAAFEMLKNQMMVGLAPAAEWVFTTLGKGAEWLNTTGVPAFTAFAAVVGPKLQTIMGDLGTTARSAFDYFQTNILPVLQQFGAYIVSTVVPAVMNFGREMADRLTPAVQAFGNFIVGTVVPALVSLGGYITGTVIPALASFGEWIRDNSTVLANVATAIGVLLLPALVRLGVGALVSGGQQVTAWAMAQAGAIKTGVVYLAQGYIIIGRWVAMGAAAVASGAQTAYVWGLYQLDAIKAAGVYAMQSLRVIGAWVAMSTAAVVSGAKTAAVWTGTIIAQAVSGAVAFAAQVARVVAGWVLMGAQSLLQAARMAAAWLIAMGPVGWVIAAVVGLVAIIIANWDTIVRVTTDIWNNVTRFISEAWTNITNWISGALRNIGAFISAAFQLYVTVFTTVWGAILNIIQTVWNNIKTSISDAINWVANWITTKMDQISLGWSIIWATIRDFVSNTWATIKTAIYNVLVWIGTFVLDSMNGVKTTWTNAWNFVKTTVSDVWTGIKTVVSDAWTGLKSTLTTLIDFVRNNIGSAFEAARDGVGTAWDAIKAKVKDPIRAVVGFINEGLIQKFNSIPGVNIPELKLSKGFMNGGYTGDGPKTQVKGVAHAGEFYFTKEQTAALGRRRLENMAHAAVRGGAATAGEGNMGGFFEGNAAAIRRHGAYYMDVAGGMGGWNFPGAARMWDGAAGVKVAVGRGNLQGRVTPRERGGGILGYTTGNNIDMSPSWMAQLGARQRTIVAAHEIGHALGLPHNSSNSIMQPNLANMASAPTSVDIRNLQRLFPGGSGKAGEGSASNPFDGLIDAMVTKLKETFPGGGMFIDMAGGLAKTGIGQVMKIVEDIKNGLKNLADNVFGKVKDFFGGGAATAPDAPLFRDRGGLLPPGLSTVLNATGGNEYVLNRRQWSVLEGLVASRAVSSEGAGGMEVNFNGPVLGDPADIWREFKTETQRASTLNSLRRVSVG